MRLQTNSAGLAIGDADARYLKLTGGTVSGNFYVDNARVSATAPAGALPSSGDPTPGHNFEHTWNGAGHTWTALNVSVTDTASGSGSLIANFKVGGSSMASISKAGAIDAASYVRGLNLRANTWLWAQSDTGGIYCGSGQDCGLVKDSTGILKTVAGAAIGTLKTKLRLETAAAPASSGDTGTAGEVRWDADYLYVCTATDTWKRTALSTW